MTNKKTTPSYPLLKIGDGNLKISVVSPSYNHAPFLRQNLDGILSQTYSNFELIVVNDGSTDETHSILSEYAARDSRIIYHRLDKNLGMMAAFELGYNMASGDLIYPTASDDYLCDSTFFESVIRFIKKVPQAAGVFGQCELVDSKTGKALGLMGGFAGTQGYISPRMCMESFLGHRGVIPGVSAIVRKDLVKMLGGYPKDLGPQNDYFINHTLAGLAGMIFFPNKVAVHRMTPDSYNATIKFKDRIRNYCHVEKRMRDLNLYEGFDLNTVILWRSLLIDSLMSTGIQKQLFQTFRQLMDGPSVLFWMHLSDSSKEFFKSISPSCDNLEKELGELKTWGMEEFKKIVGC